MKNNETIEKLNDYIQNNEFVQLAVLESIHRYYYDKCFKEEGNKFNDDDEAKFISNLLQNLSCKNPDWRYKLKKHLERYDGWKPTTKLPITNKPKEKNSVDFNISIK